MTFLAMVIDGGVNEVSQLISGNVQNVGQFFTYFGVGAAAGEATLYAGPVVGGMLLGGGNAVLDGVFSGEGVSATDVLGGMVMGGATSFVGGKIAGCVSRFVSPVLENIASPVLKSSLLNSISGAASGFALGTGFSLLHGCDLKTSLIEGGKGALLGFTTGTISGIREGVRYGRENGVNAWTGEKLVKPANGPDNLVADNGGSYSVYEGVDPVTGEVKYVGITKRDPQVRWSEHLNSGTERATLKYDLVEGATGLSKTNARVWEQTLINQMGGPRNGNFNQINSIAPKYWNRYNIPPVFMK